MLSGHAPEVAVEPSFQALVVVVHRLHVGRAVGRHLDRAFVGDRDRHGLDAELLLDGPERPRSIDEERGALACDLGGHGHGELLGHVRQHAVGHVGAAARLHDQHRDLLDDGLLAGALLAHRGPASLAGGAAEGAAALSALSEVGLVGLDHAGAGSGLMVDRVLEEAMPPAEGRAGGDAHLLGRAADRQPLDHALGELGQAALVAKARDGRVGRLREGLAADAADVPLEATRAPILDRVGEPASGADRLGPQGVDRVVGADGVAQLAAPDLDLLELVQIEGLEVFE